MYGVDIREDGSVLFLMQEAGGGIVSVNWCGEKNWVLDGVFHHTITPGDDGTFWTFEGAQSDFDPILAQVEVETGQILRKIDMGEVRRANPHAHIFDLQRLPDVPDRTHGNDIEPLPKHLAPAFPGFEAGDLLVSFRTTNLVIVLDPDTLRIKWWRVGPWDRQHDPDWGADGLITVFSNNERGVGEHSNIIAIDPGSFAAEPILLGEAYDFYSVINGAHQVTPGGGILVTSSTQGRVFEVDGKGEIVFDFVNWRSKEKAETLHVADSFFLPLDYFHFEDPPTCGPADG
jgi:hypothetical protein